MTVHLHLLDAYCLETPTVSIFRTIVLIILGIPSFTLRLTGRVIVWNILSISELFHGSSYFFAQISKYKMLNKWKPLFRKMSEHKVHVSVVLKSIMLNYSIRNLHSGNHLIIKRRKTTTTTKNNIFRNQFFFPSSSISTDSQYKSCIISLAANWSWSTLMAIWDI